MQRLDDRVSKLIRSGVAARHRSLLLLIGDQAANQVPNLANVLHKASSRRPSVVWCYQEKPQYTNQRERRNRRLAHARMRGQLDTEQVTMIDEFYTSTPIRYVHYRDCEAILGTTCDLLVLQDFPALTPNILGQTVETVAGGGLVVILLTNLSSLRQLHGVVMQYHKKFANAGLKGPGGKTGGQAGPRGAFASASPSAPPADDVFASIPTTIVNRFTGRFVALLATIRRCLVLDDRLAVLPISEGIRDMISSLPDPAQLRAQSGLTEDQEQLRELKKVTEASGDVAKAALVRLCATLDQGRAICDVYDILRAAEGDLVLGVGGARSAGAGDAGTEATRVLPELSQSGLSASSESSESASEGSESSSSSASNASSAAGDHDAPGAVGDSDGSDSDPLSDAPQDKHALRREASSRPTKDELEERRKLNLLRKHNKAAYQKRLADEAAARAAAEAPPEPSLPIFSVIASRGRGKSAALGMLAALLVARGFGSIVVSAPHPSNVQTLFDFCIRGLKELGYREFSDFRVRKMGSKVTDPIVGLTVSRSGRAGAGPLPGGPDAAGGAAGAAGAAGAGGPGPLLGRSKQTISFVFPEFLVPPAVAQAAETAENLGLPGGATGVAGTAGTAGAGGAAASTPAASGAPGTGLPTVAMGADAIMLDECAAIPLLTVKALLNSLDPTTLCFVSSTCQGYEASGRSLSLKLLRSIEEKGTRRGQRLRKLDLEVPIRYAPGDDVEAWLNRLLCMDPGEAAPSGAGAPLELSSTPAPAFPPPGSCMLYRVSKDTLFSGSEASEAFLQRIWAVFTTAHYRNSPNDLILLSDNPMHDLFVLLAPVTSRTRLPTVLCVCQVAYEGGLRRDVVRAALDHQERLDGDMVSWLLAQQFQQYSFAELAGVRVVRIATNPAYSRGGYGSRALFLLREFFAGRLVDLELVRRSGWQEPDRGLEGAGQRLPTLLQNLGHVHPVRINWLGVAFGLNAQLHAFWERAGYRTVYLRQAKNELTGEHTAVMLSPMPGGEVVSEFAQEYRQRFIRLLRFDFRALSIELCFRVLDEGSGAGADAATTTAAVTGATSATSSQPRYLLEPSSMRRLEALEKHRLDLGAVLDLVPLLASEVFAPGGALRELPLSHVQRRLLVAVGFLGRPLASAALELGLDAGAGYNQAGALLTKALGRAFAALSELRGPGGQARQEPAEPRAPPAPRTPSAPRESAARQKPAGREAPGLPQKPQEGRRRQKQ